MRFFRLFILTMLPAALVLAGAQAHHTCATWTTSEPQIDTGAASPATGSRHYVAEDCIGRPCPSHLFSFWVYEESNGIDGLQRGDPVVDDTCHGMISPDLLIY